MSIVMEYLFWYKISCLIVGLTIIYLGYLLFVKGIFNESGDIDANFKNYKLTVKKAAPGTFFVLFGAIIIGFSIFKGLELTSGRPTEVKRTQAVEKGPPSLPDSEIIKK